MARDPQTISDSIDNQLTVGLEPYGVELSISQVADWKLWRDTAVNTDYDFETVLDITKSDIENYVDTQKIGSRSWYAVQSRAFQFGDTLLISAEGVLYYAIIDETKQVIKLAAVKEVEDGVTGVVTLVIKVATIVADIVQPLTSAQLLGFEDYMRNVKIVGTRLQIVSQAADVILYDVDVIYNPEIPSTTVEANILAALEAFRTTYGFDPTFYRSTFELVIKSAAGVVALRVNTLTGTPDGGAPAAISLDYELESGHFNYDVASVITLTPQ